MRTARSLFVLTLGLLPLVGDISLSQSLDPAGNRVGSALESQAIGTAAGGVLDSFPNPDELRGLTFAHGNLWGVNESGKLYEMNADSGSVISTVSADLDLAFGLGWDATRAVFVITDPLADLVVQVNSSGVVTGSLPSPGDGSVGAAYDPLRDGYWIADWKTDRLDLIDPDTGIIVQSLAAAAGASRIAGTGYDAADDALLYNSRDSAETYLVRASDGVPIDVFPTPGSSASSLDHGQGAAVRPARCSGFVSHFDVAQIFEVELELPCVFDDGFESGDTSRWSQTKQ